MKLMDQAEVKTSRGTFKGELYFVAGMNVVVWYDEASAKYQTSEWASGGIVGPGGNTPEHALINAELTILNVWNIRDAYTEIGKFLSQAVGREATHAAYN